MGNCLITKLKGSIDNDNLMKYGELKVELYVEASGKIMAIETTDDSHNAISTNRNVLSLSENPVSGSDTVTATNTDKNVYSYGYTGDLELSIMNKYKIAVLNCRSFNSYLDITNLENLHTLFVYGRDNINGGLKGEIPPSMVSFTVNPNQDCSRLTIKSNKPYLNTLLVPRSTFTISDIVSNCPLLTSFTLYGNTDTGDFGSLGSLRNLNSIAGFAYATGSIETFVANKRLAGVTSGNATISYISANVTFNGAPAYSGIRVPLSWDASHIEYNGVTIDA